MKKFLPFLIALFAGIAQGYSLAPANEWLQLAALAVLFFIFAGLRTAKAGFLAGLFFGIGWFVTSLAWLYVSVHDYGYQPPVFAAFVVFIFSCYLALYPAMYVTIMYIVRWLNAYLPYFRSILSKKFMHTLPFCLFYFTGFHCPKIHSHYTCCLFVCQTV